MGVLDGKAAVIIGGAGFLGSPYAKAMAQEGARVLVNDINAQGVDRVVAEVRAAGGEAMGNTDSVAVWSSAGHAIDTCVDAFGQIDCLVNGAQHMRQEPVWEISEESLGLAVAVHLKGHVALTHHAARCMIKQRSGSIITITSRTLHGRPGLSLYAAVKAGILGATWSWALELADYGVRVNSVSPSASHSLDDPTLGKPSLRMPWQIEPTMKKQISLPRAETVASLVVYLASDESRWVTGQVIFLSGDTLALMQQPKYRLAFKPDGWSFQDLRENFKPTVGAELSQPGIGEPRYKWYEGVG